MTFEHSVDPRIRPSIVPRAEPAHGVASRTQIAEAGAADDGGPSSPAAEDDFSFYDLLDVINPLQHIPVVSSLYREITGDEIKGPARILGGMLFGGPVGFVASAVNAIAVEASGRDLGEAAIATLFGDDAPVPDDTALAEATGIVETAAGAADAPEAAASTAPEAATAAAPQDAPAAALPLAATAVAEAPQGRSATELLMGRAALDALAADLRRADRAPSPAAVPDEPGNNGETSGATAAAAGTTAAAAAGVPANLIGIGSRDRRGLGPVMPAQPRPPAPEIPDGAPAAAAKTGTIPAGPNGRLALIDPALLGPPRPGALLSDEAAPGHDISAQMLDALKKYEALMRARRGGAAPAPGERPHPS